MKKIKYLLLFSMILAVLTITAQNVPMSVKAAGTMNRDAQYSCLDNSLFSQLPVPIEAGWYGDDAYTFYRIADDYSVVAPFSTMRFWGSNIYTCPPGTSVNFIIKFYERNTGDPAIPGPEVYSYSLSTVPQPINLLFGNDYQIDLTFPTVTLLDGWISLTRVNPGDGCSFVWLGNYTGNSASYDGSWQPSQGMLAFCIGGEGVPQTPISNWALIIGIILIGTFVIIRFRRMV
jgi:hypothetical protein